jgi:hypothetical protein
MSSGEYLFLDTRDRDSGTNQDARFSFNDSIREGPFYMILEKVQLPHVFYPFSTERHTTRLYVELSGTASDGIKEVGLAINRAYTADELSAELNQNLTNTLPGDWAVTYNTTTGKFSIATSAQAGSWRIVDGVDSIHREIGWDITRQTSFISFGPPGTTGFDVADLSGTKYIDVITNLGGSSNYSSGPVTPIARVPVEVPFGNMVFFVVDTLHRLDGSASGTMQLQLRDDRGYTIQMGENHSVAYTFVLGSVDL